MKRGELDLAIVGRGPAALGFSVGLGGGSSRRVAIVGPTVPLSSSMPSTRQLSFPKSPKLRRPDIAREVDSWRLQLPVAASAEHNVVLMGVHGTGGGARHWGAACMPFSAAQLERNGFDTALFAEGYDYWGRRMRVSGNRADSLASIYQALPRSSPTPRSHHVMRLEGVFCGGRVRAGSARVAVETEGASACTGCNRCLAGCAVGSIWAPKEHDFREAMPSAITIDALVVGLHKDSLGFALTLRSGSGPDWTVRARQVVLACGAPTTFALLHRLVLDPPEAKLLFHPSFAFVLAAGLPQSTPMFGMAQAALHMQDEQGDEFATGYVYSGQSLAEYEEPVFSDIGFVDRMAQTMAPFLLFGSGYLSADLGEATLTMNSGILAQSPVSLDRVARYREAKALVGAWAREVNAPMLAFMQGKPGVDLHYAGGIPRELLASYDGRTGAIHAVPGLYVVGGAAFRFMPARSPTLSFIVQAWAAARYQGA